MKRLFYIIVLPMLACIGIVGCGEPENEVSINPDAVIAEADHTLASITVTSTAAWILETDAQWLTPDKTEGDGGTHRVTLSFTANTDTASRKAMVTVSSMGVEKHITVLQRGKNGTTPDPEYKGKLIRKVTLTEIDYDTEIDEYEFEYDTEGRLAKMSNKWHDDDEEYSETYTVKYDNSTIIFEETEEDEQYVALLDNAGRIEKITYMGDEPETFKLKYDAEGHLASEETVDEYDAPCTQKYVWQDGNISLSISDDGYSSYPDTTKYAYSQYENKGNLDLNHLMSGSFSSNGIGGFGLINATGVRTANYLIPYSWDEDEALIADNIDRVTEDLIGTLTTRTSTRSYLEKDKATVDFKFDADGDITSASTTIPEYEVTYETTYKIVVDNPDKFYYEDGIKYYYARYEFVSEKEISRKQVDPERYEVKVEYL